MIQIYDLETLVRDERQNNLFDFFIPTFTFDETLPYERFVVGKEEVGRIDLISNSIYGNVDQVALLLNVNNIDNPLNIFEGDVLIYPPLTSIDNFRPQLTDNQNAINQLSNTNKSTRKDPNRQKYIEDSFELPPTINKVPAPPVKIENNQIRIG